ncbi:hypothetical protein SLEP1_g2247 [Rubroshorea leprosula]|uniref:Uncharacterized protein n=1 Tax=Rubroshorea leprosula TaxID=152421 RepID=A0AAV5HMF2_9ROSI|nr:hypothetical protein SLEP1_g2247 [Rubroshorea leprosula]
MWPRFSFIRALNNCAQDSVLVLVLVVVLLLFLNMGSSGGRGKSYKCPPHGGPEPCHGPRYLVYITVPPGGCKSSCSLLGGAYINVA